MRREFLGVALVLCGLAAGSCQKTDLGYQPCYFTKVNKLPDGGKAVVRIKESEITAQGQDFISLAAVECDDFICVRDFGTPRRDAGTDGGDPDLSGYCTHACSNEGSTVGCESDQNQVPGRPYTCRALLMDQESLRKLCVENPALCNGIVGNERSALFCARGLADAGQSP
jgi:hypothetical protein